MKRWVCLAGILFSLVLMLLPGGVSMTLSFIEGDCFGFIDLNAQAKGFGLGKFALSIF